MGLYWLLLLFLPAMTNAQTGLMPNNFFTQQVGPIMQQMQKAQYCNPQTLLVATKSPYSVQETVTRVLKVLEQKQLQVYSTQGPNRSGILPNQVMIMFGPAIPKGQPQKPTEVNPLFPLRMTIGSTSQNITYIAYAQPSKLPKCFLQTLASETKLQELDLLFQDIVDQALHLPADSLTKS